MCLVIYNTIFSKQNKGQIDTINKLDKAPMINLNMQKIIKTIGGCTLILKLI